MTPPSSSPRRVLMTADTVGGVWHYALQLARCLAKRGTDTVLATMGRPPTDMQKQAAAAIPGLVHLHEEYRLEWMPDADADVRRAADWLLALERSYAPDLVHLNGYHHAIAPFAAPKAVMAHSCVRSWWRAVHGKEAPPEWAGYGRAVAGGLQAADAVMAPTAAFLTEIEDIYGPLPKARVIHNGRIAAGFRPGQKAAVILTAGRLWDEAKNIAALDAIAPTLSWPVLVAGDDRGPDGAADVVRNSRPLGLLSEAELADRMSSAAVFALPARYEPFGLATLEAALSGCALVLGDIPTLRELWDGAALFAPPDDRDALRDILELLACDPVFLAAQAAAARERALRYGAERMTDAVCELYASLLDPVASPRSRPVNSMVFALESPRDPAACAS